jgi:hypothetical protein
MGLSRFSLNLGLKCQSVPNVPLEEVRHGLSTKRALAMKVGALSAPFLCSSYVSDALKPLGRLPHHL